MTRMLGNATLAELEAWMINRGVRVLVEPGTRGKWVAAILSSRGAGVRAKGLGWSWLEALSRAVANYESTVVVHETV